MFSVTDPPDLLFTLIRIRILPFSLLRILPVTFRQIWTLHCFEMTIYICAGDDGKAVKVSCYFINYKIFVNIVKYKLDLMRKRMEVEERDATSRSSFRCSNCNKQFSDLEADQLFDFISQVTIPLLLLLQQL